MKVIESKQKQPRLMGTSRDLYLEERRQQVLRRIQADGRVSVGQLSQEFGVSEVTIRMDLQALADRKLIVRTHGGAVAGDTNLYELALAMRRQQQVQEKSRIGKAGAALVANGDAIILDSSSTALAIAQHLKNHRHLTIITNSLAVAQEMLDAPDVTVVMSGGRVRRDTASLVGPDGLDMLCKYNIQKGFFGAHGITVMDGLTDVSADEAEVKRRMAAMCRQVIAVLDATKWGKVGLVSFARLDQIRTVITDRDAPADRVAEVRALGTEIILV
jgi:DeoR/GlpR family transcriptional regulator of sugar metabolism